MSLNHNLLTGCFILYNLYIYPLVHQSYQYSFTTGFCVNYTTGIYLLDLETVCTVYTVSGLSPCSGHSKIQRGYSLLFFSPQATLPQTKLTRTGVFISNSLIPWHLKQIQQRQTTFSQFSHCKTQQTDGITGHCLLWEDKGNDECESVDL